jgi:hypothetical protein
LDLTDEYQDFYGEVYDITLTLPLILHNLDKIVDIFVKYPFIAPVIDFVSFSCWWFVTFYFMEWLLVMVITTRPHSMFLDTNFLFYCHEVYSF